MIECAGVRLCVCGCVFVCASTYQRGIFPHPTPPLLCTNNVRHISCRITLMPSHLYRESIMGKGCVTAIKYFLFLFNLIFFVSIFISNLTICIDVDIEQPPNVCQERCVLIVGGFYRVTRGGNYLSPLPNVLTPQLPPLLLSMNRAILNKKNKKCKCS